MTRIGIIGGGPGGYEAALVAAAQPGTEVTVIDRDGLGGSAVLTDCVPSKTLIATAEVVTDAAESGELGVTLDDGGNPSGRVGVDLAQVDKRVLALARAQSDDIATKLAREGVRVVRGVGRLDGPSRIVAMRGCYGAQLIASCGLLELCGIFPCFQTSPSTKSRSGCCRS